jgi:hypothetical protein
MVISVVNARFSSLLVDYLQHHFESRIHRPFPVAIDKGGVWQKVVEKTVI